MAPLALTGPDTVVLVLMGFFALRGAWKGFVWQAIRTVGLVAGFWLGGAYGGAVGAWLADRFSFVPRAGSDIVGWVAVIVGVFVVAGLLGHLVRSLVRQARLSGADRLFGCLLGAVLGLGVAAFGFTLWASTRPDSEVRETFSGSTSTEWMARFVDAVHPLFPEGVRERWGGVLRSLDRIGPAPH